MTLVRRASRIMRKPARPAIKGIDSSKINRARYAKRTMQSDASAEAIQGLLGSSRLRRRLNNGGKS